MTRIIMLAVRYFFSRPPSATREEKIHLISQLNASVGFKTVLHLRSLDHQNLALILCSYGGRLILASPAVVLLLGHDLLLLFGFCHPLL